MTFLRIHETTLPHLDVIEKAILDALIKQGRACVITDSGDVIQGKKRIVEAFPKIRV
jgi:hypothetical protein